MGLRQGTRRDHLMRAMTDARWAFEAYEAIRPRLPGATFPGTSREVGGLPELMDEADAFFLDAFGVLNVGESAIPGAVDAVDRLTSAGKRVVVVSNAAGYCKRVMLERYRRLGFRFGESDVVSSRDVLLAALSREPARRWGLMAASVYGHEGIDHIDGHFLGDDPSGYDAADGFLFLGSGEWSEGRQALLEDALRARPRPVLVGNPDLVAPRETGLSKEPGHFAHRLVDATGVAPRFFGKPFANIFDHALSDMPQIARDRIVMVGDTLHTDILGGAAAGLKTALVTGHGALVGLEPEAAIDACGIRPDFMMRSI
ncbi:MAG: HAD hydrolase-like protein [Rhodobacteraceae bacterium]|nr:HAD hydrolase-like protein [Paracoccaceae bacterium]